MWNGFIIGLLALLPIQFATGLFGMGDVALFRILILVFFFVAGFALFLRQELRLPSRGFLMWMISAGVVIFFGILASGELAWSARKAIFLVNYFLWFLILALLMHRGWLDDRKLGVGLVISGLIASLLGVAQWFGQFVFGLDAMLDFWGASIAPVFLGAEFAEAVLTYSSWLVNVGGITIFRAIGFFPDPHMLGFFLNLTVFWALGFFVKKKKWWWGMIFLVISVGVALTFSRGAYVGFLAGFGMYAWIIFRHRTVDVRWLFGGVALVFVITVGLLGTQNFVRDRLYDTFLSRDASGDARLLLWQQATQIVGEHPFFGVGFGGFPEKVEPSATYRDPIYAHNMYLDIATEVGILGLAVWLWGFGWIFWRFWKLGKEDIWYSAGVAGLVAFFVHGIFDTPIYSVHVMGVLCVMIAIAFTPVKVCYHSSKERDSRVVS